MKTKITAFTLALTIVISLFICSGCSGDTKNPGGKLGEDQAASNIMTNPAYDKLDLSEYITLGQYLGIEIKKIDATVSEEQLNSYIQGILEENITTKTVTDRPLEIGDRAILTFEGKMDNMETPSGLSTGDTPALLEMGSNSYIPGFEEGLMGVMPGETVTLNLAFPDPYEVNTDLSGQAVTFVVEVQGIEEIIIPEFNDYFVATISDHNTIDEYKAAVTLELYDQNYQSAKGTAIGEILTSVIESSTVLKFPQEVVDGCAEDMLSYYNEIAVYDGYASLEVMLEEVYGKTIDEFKEESLLYAQDTVTEELVMYAIARAENINVTRNEYNEGLERFAGYYGVTKEELEAQYGEALISQSVLWDKLLEHLFEKAYQVD